MPGSVIVAAARTPIGRLSGGLGGFSAAELGGFAIKAALERAGVKPGEVDHVIMGQVIQAGGGQVPARQAAVAAGIPFDVPANTLNKACLSSLNAIYLADQMVAAGEADIVVAGGQESMTNAPHLVQGLRSGIKLGDGALIDSMMHDGLSDAYDRKAMGAITEQHTQKAGIGRDRMDDLAANSHERAALAAKKGRFEQELVPVEVPQRKGDPIIIDTDEGVRPGTTAESLGKLRPAFDKEGWITAGNASQISDGGAAVVVMSKAEAEHRGLKPLAEIVGYGMVAGPDNSLLKQPSGAIRKALERSGRKLEDVKLFEMNEAFASVACASTDDLGVDAESVNVDGGAIALGHPIGASGARIAMHLAFELGRRGGGLGAAALCGGGGQGDAILLEVPAAE